MHRIAAPFASPFTACSAARPDPVAPPKPGGGTRASRPAGHGRDDPRRTGPVTALLAGAMLLVAGSAAAQPARIGPEWGGFNHQPTQAEVARRERQDGVRPPEARRRQDARSVEQLDQQLLHEEAVDPPAKVAPR